MPFFQTLFVKLSNFHCDDIIEMKYLSSNDMFVSGRTSNEKNYKLTQNIQNCGRHG